MLRRNFVMAFLATAPAIFAPRASQADFFSPETIEAAKKRGKLIRAAKKEIPFDKYGHRGNRWQEFIALKGDRRITFRTDLGLNGAREQIEFAAYYISSGQPFATTFWVLENGRNVDLAVKQSSGQFILKPYIGLRKLRAWGSKIDDVAFYLRASGESQY